MFSTIFQIMAGFLCGFLFIEWFPISFPASPAEIFAACIVKPVQFFSAAIVFIIGFLINAELVCKGIIQACNFFLNRRITVVDFLFSIFFMIAFIILFLIGFWQTVVFFCFSILYGIISIDFKELKLAKV